MKLHPAFAIALTLLTASALVAEPRQKYNVLFIAVDDLRPQLGCYGHAETLARLDKMLAAGPR